MLRPYSLLLCLFFALTTHQMESSSLKTLVNAWASQNGEVLIQKDFYGFYVDVDYSYFPSSSSKTSRMLLGLSNSDTLVSYSCQGFNTYYCGLQNCTQYPSAKDIDYPSFSASTHYAKFEAYLDYQNWNLQNYGFIAQNCTSRDSNFGTGRGGVIAMGTGSSSLINFINSPIFSFTFDKNLTKGKLLFRIDNSISDSGAINVWNADSNWRTTFSNGYVQVGVYQTYFSGDITFDIHAKAMGFPFDIFRSIITGLTRSQNIYCSDALINPDCDYYGYHKDLPVLKLFIAGRLIDIPPAIYVKNPTKDWVVSITLNLQALSPSISGAAFVTSSFKDSVILDVQFMSHYYVVFDRNSGTNQLKLYARGTSNSKPNIIIFSGLVVFVVVLSICCCVFKKKKPLPSPAVHDLAVMIQPPLLNKTVPGQPINGYAYPQNVYPVVSQYTQQPCGFIQQPEFCQPQPFQQPGYTNYRS